MFLASVLLTVCMMIVNMVVFFIYKSSQNVSQTAIIVIVAVAAGVLGIPILGFFLFHLYLALSRNTTR